MSQQINLFNPLFQKKRELFTALMLAQVIAAILVISAGMYVYDYFEVQKLTRQAKSESVSLESARAKLAEVVSKYAPQPKNQALEKKVGELEQQLIGEEAVLEVLQSGSLGNTRGYSEYMRAFARRTISGLWLTEFSIKGAGMDMAIGGRTLRPELVPLYIQRLNQETVTQGRAFAALEMQQPKPQAATNDSSPGAVAGGRPAQIPNYLEFRLYSGAAEERRQ